MLTEYLLEAVFGLVTALFSGFPHYSVASDMTALASAAGSLGSFAYLLNGYFPIAFMGICLGILAAFEIGEVLWRFFVFVYDRIPFKFT